MPLNLLLVIASILWILSFEVWLARSKHSSRKSSTRRQDDRSSQEWLWKTSQGSIIVGLILGFQTFGMLEFAHNYIILSGFALIVLGQIIRWIAIRTLGEYFTVDVSIQEGQEIIDRGMYKLIRHPAYAGMLLSFLGLGLAIGNWLSIIIIFFPTFFMFIHRMNLEEEILCEEFGDDYRDYMKRTKRLIPKVY